VGDGEKSKASKGKGSPSKKREEEGTNLLLLPRGKRGRGEKKNMRNCKAQIGEKEGKRTASYIVRKRGSERRKKGVRPNQAGENTVFSLAVKAVRRVHAVPFIGLKKGKGKIIKRGTAGIPSEKNGREGFLIVTGKNEIYFHSCT